MKILTNKKPTPAFLAIIAASLGVDPEDIEIQELDATPRDIYGTPTVDLKTAEIPESDIPTTPTEANQNDERCPCGCEDDLKGEVQEEPDTLTDAIHRATSAFDTPAPEYRVASSNTTLFTAYIKDAAQAACRQVIAKLEAMQPRAGVNLTVLIDDKIDSLTKQAATRLEGRIPNAERIAKSLETEAPTLPSWAIQAASDAVQEILIAMIAHNWASEIATELPFTNGDSVEIDLHDTLACQLDDIVNALLNAVEDNQ